MGSEEVRAPEAPAKQPNYTSHYEHSLDDRNRISIPSEWRFAHGSEDMLLAVQKVGPNGNFIQLLPPAIADHLKSKFDAIPFFDQAGQAAKEDFYSKSQQVWFDKAGRILLNENLLKHAGIKLAKGEPVMLRGSGSTFSIYSASVWASSEARGPVDHSQTLSRLAI